MISEAWRHPQTRSSLLQGRIRRLAIGAALLVATVSSGQSLVVENFAGSRDVYEAADGYGSDVRFRSLSAATVDSRGFLFLVDSNSHTIRRVALDAEVTTFAGLALEGGHVDGRGADARFFRPTGIAVDAQDNLYVAEWGNSVVRKITADGTVSTFAGVPGIWGSQDGQGAAALFKTPYHVAVDAEGFVFVADNNDDTIRKISPEGMVTTFAGLSGGESEIRDGKGSAARFASLGALAFGPDGDLFVVDQFTIRRISPDGTVATVVGKEDDGRIVDGPIATARLKSPGGLLVQTDGRVIFGDDATIRSIDTDGNVRTIAGQKDHYAERDGVSADAYLTAAFALAQWNGDLAFGATTTLRSMAGDGSLSTIAGVANTASRPPAEPGEDADGQGADCYMQFPFGLTLAPDGTIYTTEERSHLVRRLSPDGKVETLAGEYRVAGNNDAPIATDAHFRWPAGLAFAPSGDLYISEIGNNTIRRIAPGGAVTTFAGLALSAGFADGMGTAARFDAPYGLAFDAGGNLWVADVNNHVIRKIAPDGTVTTVAGMPKVSGSADGIGAAARFSGPAGLAFDAQGNLWISDQRNATVRRMAPDGAVTTVAGKAGEKANTDGVGTGARFIEPNGLMVEEDGRVLLVDSGADAERIREIQPDGTVVTLAGGSLGDHPQAFQLGTGDEVNFAWPVQIVKNDAGIYYITNGNNGVLKAVRALSDRAAIDSPTGPALALRQLSTSQPTAESFSWRVTRRPSGSSAQLSDEAIPNPTFRPDVEDRFEFELTARAGVRLSRTKVVLDVAGVQSGNAPVAGFDWSPESAAVGESISFTDRSLEAPESWQWDFGDGTTSTFQSPTHAYGAVGSYAVTLTVENPWGQSSLTKNVEVGALAAGVPLMLPVVATAPGAFGTYFVTDVRVANLTDRDAEVEILFSRTGAPKDRLRATQSIPAGRTMRYENFLLEVFGVFEEVGSVELLSEVPLLVSARIYNTASTGTYGQFVLSQPTSEAIAKGTIGHLLQLSKSTSFRSNVGFAEATGQPATVRVVLYDAAGVSLGSRDYELSAWAHLQVNDIFAALGAPATNDARATLEVIAGDGAILGYASVVDNLSSDQIFVPVLEASPAGPLAIAASASAPGAGGSYWRTDIRVANPASAERHVDLEYIRFGASGNTPATASYTLAPGALLVLDDAVASAFAASGAGSLRLLPDGPGLVATSRTYDVSGVGTYGQFIGALPESAAIGLGDRPVFALHVEHDGDFRPNVGFFNVAAAPGVVRATVYDQQGEAAGFKEFQLASHSGIQVNDLYNAFQIFPVRPNARVGFEVVGGDARILAYASIVDNFSNDPIYVRAIDPLGLGVLEIGEESRQCPR